MSLLASKMNLKVLFCDCIKKIVESLNEGINITHLEAIVGTNVIPPLLYEQMEIALTTVAYKILTHFGMTVSDDEEMLKVLDVKLDAPGLEIFQNTIEKFGLECSEIISFVDCKDLVGNKEVTQMLDIPEFQSHLSQCVSKIQPFDSITDVKRSLPDLSYEKPQLQSSEVAKSEVL